MGETTLGLLNDIGPTVDPRPHYGETVYSAWVSYLAMSDQLYYNLIVFKNKSRRVIGANRTMILDERQCCYEIFNNLESYTEGKEFTDEARKGIADSLIKHYSMMTGVSENEIRNDFIRARLSCLGVSNPLQREIQSWETSEPLMI